VRETTSRAMHTTFEVGIFLKGVDGGLQIVGAALLLLIKPRQIRRAVVALVVLTVLDVVVIVLTWGEYNRLRHTRPE
jgi:uncharacterized membrane protein